MFNVGFLATKTLPAFSSIYEDKNYNQAAFEFMLNSSVYTGESITILLYACKLTMQIARMLLLPTSHSLFNRTCL